MAPSVNPWIGTERKDAVRSLINNSSNYEAEFESDTDIKVIREALKKQLALFGAPITLMGKLRRTGKTRADDPSEYSGHLILGKSAIELLSTNKFNAIKDNNGVSAETTRFINLLTRYIG
jgi:hypothetical protein